MVEVTVTLGIAIFVGVVGVLVLVAIMLIGGDDDSGGGGGGGSDNSLLEQAILSNQEAIAQSLEIAATANQAATAANTAATAAQESADEAVDQYGSLQAFTQTIDTKADQALVDASQAAGDAGNALETANTAQTGANTASQAAYDADQTAQGAVATADQALGVASSAKQNKGYMVLSRSANQTGISSGSYINWDVVVSSDRATSVASAAGEMPITDDFQYDQSNGAFVLRADAIYRISAYVRIEQNNFAGFRLQDVVADAIVTGTNTFGVIGQKSTAVASNQPVGVFILKGNELTLNSDGYGEVRIQYNNGNTTTIQSSSKIICEKIGEVGLGIGV